MLIPAGQKIASHNFIEALQEDIEELRLRVGDKSTLKKLLSREGKLTVNHILYSIYHIEH